MKWLFKWLFNPEYRTVYTSKCEYSYYLKRTEGTCICELQYSKIRDNYRIISNITVDGYESLSAYIDCVEQKAKLQQLK